MCMRILIGGTIAALTLCGGGGLISPASASSVLSLEECIEVAMERSPVLAQAQERLSTADGSVGLARSSLLPTLSSSIGRSEVRPARIISERLFEASGEGLLDVSQHSYYLSARMSQPLWHGGANWSAHRSASNRRQAAREGVRDARQGLVLAVTEGYLGLLRAQHLLGVAEETLEASRHRQGRVEALFEVGSVARADVLQNRVQMAQDELALIQARNNLEIARAQLLSSMGLSVDQDISVRELPLTEKTFPEPASLIDQSQERNPALADLRWEVAASDADVSQARAGRYPMLDLSWNYGWSGNHFPESATSVSTDDRWELTFSMSWNLFDGMATRSRISSAKHTLRRMEEQLEQSRLDLALEVKRQHSSLMEAHERIRVAQESIAAAEEQLRLQEERYRLGAATLLELIEAQVGLTRARTSEVEARYDYSLAEARLDRAVGVE